MAVQQEVRESGEVRAKPEISGDSRSGWTAKGRMVLLEGVRWGLRQGAERFLADTQCYPERSKALLKSILQLNGPTEWGRMQGLAGPRAQDVFETLPLTTYQDYVPYILRMANGEKNVLTRHPVEYFAESSGTTGPQKLIPITRQRVSVAVRSSMVIPFGMGVRTGVLGPIRGPIFMPVTGSLRGKTPGGIFKGAATTSGFQRMGAVANLLFTAPQEVIKIQPQETARYLHLLFALRARNLWTIASFFPPMLLYILRDLEAKASQLLQDLADGTLRADLELSTAERGAIEAYLKPSPARAAVVERCLSQGRFVLRDLWPDVGGVFTVATGPFRFYIDQLRPYLGEVPVFSPIYAASESSGLGFALGPEQSDYVLAAQDAYIELLPLSERGDAIGPLIPGEQAELGQDYEVVITNYSGLFRYRMGDVVRMKRFEGRAPVVEFLERRGSGLNLIGEKTAEHHLVEACEYACRREGAGLVDYFMTVDLSVVPGRYLLVMEPIPGFSSPEQVRRLLQATETALRRVAAAYEDVRSTEAVGPLGGLVLKPGAFERYRKIRMSQGISPSQLKVPRVFADPGMVREFFSDEIRLLI